MPTWEEAAAAVFSSSVTAASASLSGACTCASVTATGNVEGATVSYNGTDIVTGMMGALGSLNTAAATLVAAINALEVRVAALETVHA